MNAVPTPWGAKINYGILEGEPVYLRVSGGSFDEVVPYSMVAEYMLLLIARISTEIWMSNRSRTVSSCSGI